MTISVGDKLPEVTFKRMTAGGPEEKTTAEVFSGKKIVLFAIPGAFTPTCHLKHMPGFIELADELKAKGADDIVCITVNDVFVTGAWASDTGAEGKVTVLADGNADFTKAVGLELDGSEIGLGIRSKRYAAIINDGVVEKLIIEEVPSMADQTSAAQILKAL